MDANEPEPSVKANLMVWLCSIRFSATQPNFELHPHQEVIMTRPNPFVKLAKKALSPAPLESPPRPESSLPIFHFSTSPPIAFNHHEFTKLQAKSRKKHKNWAKRRGEGGSTEDKGALPRTENTPPYPEKKTTSV